LEGVECFKVRFVEKKEKKRIPEVLFLFERVEIKGNKI